MNVMKKKYLIFLLSFILLSVYNISFAYANEDDKELYSNVEYGDSNKLEENNQINASDDLNDSKTVKRPVLLNYRYDFYSWKDNKGNKGWELVQPLSVSTNIDRWNLGLKTSYVKALNHSSGKEGHFSGFSDTNLSISYNQKMSDPKWMVKYLLDINLPTGEGTLNQNKRNAIMDSWLVGRTRFGEGYNYTPGINVIRVLSNKDLLGFGFSKTLKKDFTANEELPGMKYHPSNETTAVIDWMHLEPNFKSKLGLMYVNSSLSTYGGKPLYEGGDKYILFASETFNLKNEQKLMLNMSLIRQKPNKYQDWFGNFVEETGNSNGPMFNWGVDWYMPLNKGKDSLIVSFENKILNDNDYSPIDYLYYAGRRRYSGGITYNHMLDKDSLVTLKAKKYFMNESNLSENKYHGLEFSLGYTTIF
ncbi:MAG: hypothetical protein ACI3ZR_08310 [bacterium]